MHPQFTEYEGELTLLTSNSLTRYRCNCCGLHFMPEDDYYFSGRQLRIQSGAVRLTNFCPVCTGCELRFTSYNQVLENKLDKLQPYSMVTVYSPKNFSIAAIRKFAFTAAVLNFEMHKIISIEFSEEKMISKNQKDIIDTAKNMLRNYEFFGDCLARQIDSKTSDVQQYRHNPQKHKELGQSITIGITDTMNIEKGDSIVVVPSIEHIQTCILKSIYKVEEIEQWLGLKIKRQD